MSTTPARLRAALQAECGFCGALEQADCTPGLHMDRVATAYRAGLLTRDDVQAVMYAVTVFTRGTVVPAEVLAGAA